MHALTLLVPALLGLALLYLAWTSLTATRTPATLAALLPARGLRRMLGGALFTLAGAASLASLAVPFIAFFAACLALLGAAWLATGVVHSRLSGHWPLPAGVAALSLAMAVMQPLGLKVLALPKADALPFRPVPARVVKTYDEGLWFEGIAAGADGTLYLAGNRGLDFGRSDYYHAARGEIIARRPDGSERVVFRTPSGATAGVIAIAADGTLYCTSHGASPGVWRVAPDGHGERVVTLPGGAWPNGLDIGPDGLLYSPDSALGLVWRIDPRSGQAERVLEDARLLARPWISLAPGANGLHFRGRDLYVTVSDRTTVLRYTLADSGRFGPPAVVATGIPGDDFAIAADGTLFITTHPYNTVVAVAPDGERSIIAKEEQHIVGATDAVFGRTAADADTLYVVTDGGAFTGGPRTRGQLVALTPGSRPQPPSPR